jgi:flagellar hook-associated protein FlgK
VELERRGTSGPGRSLTLSESYLNVVDQVSNLTRQSQVAATALEVVHQQAVEARESVSGVSLDEEAANLIRFQQAYQAAAKSMQVASQMFDAVLRI